MELEFDVIDPPGESFATVIWLHGMGQDSDSLIPVVRRSGLASPGSGVRHVFRAPPSVPGLTGARPRAPGTASGSSR